MKTLWYNPKTGQTAKTLPEITCLNAYDGCYLISTAAINQSTGQDSKEEIERCKNSPYYYATKYLTVNGKPFTTRLNEEDFNKYFNEVCRLNNKL